MNNVNNDITATEPRDTAVRVAESTVALLKRIAALEEIKTGTRPSLGEVVERMATKDLQKRERSKDAA